jgi:hypothetical protein
MSGLRIRVAGTLAWPGFFGHSAGQTISRANFSPAVRSPQTLSPVEIIDLPTRCAHEWDARMPAAILRLAAPRRQLSEIHEPAVWRLSRQLLALGEGARQPEAEPAPFLTITLCCLSQSGQTKRIPDCAHQSGRSQNRQTLSNSRLQLAWTAAPIGNRSLSIVSHARKHATIDGGVSATGIDESSQFLRAGESPASVGIAEAAAYGAGVALLPPAMFTAELEKGTLIRPFEH